MSTENKELPELPENTEIKKEFFLTTWALNNRTSAIILSLIIAVGGMMAYSSMPKELFPEIVMPKIYVRTIYPGNSPLDIENLITRPLEKEIKPVSGIDEMRSTSLQDVSVIMIDFNPDVEVEEALKDVKDAVDKAMTNLPSDLDIDPIVMDVNFSELPVMNINLSGDYSVDDLKEYAEYLQEKMEVIPELSKVEIKGALNREININVDVHKMEEVEVSFGDIESAIAYENMNISGGDLLTADGARRSIRVVGEYANVEAMENTIVKAEKGNIIYLRDIAEVKDAYKDRESYARLDQQAVVSVDIVKKSGENLLAATAKIQEIIAEAQKHKFPDDLKITITNDQSDQVKSQLSNLENSIISGVILVVLVLLFYLGLRNALFVGIAIPMSMFMSYMILSMLGTTINMMVLFALILALGMLVDNGIVVIDNIFRHLSLGRTPFESAKYGVGEIAIPIISSTATTVAAFLPLLFWDSIMGEFMKYLPITLIAVLSSSLFVALVINPVLSVMLKDQAGRSSKKKMWIAVAVIVVFGGLFYVSGKTMYGNLAVIAAVLVLTYNFFFEPASVWFMEKFLPWQDEQYRKFLSFALGGKKPYLFFFGTFLLVFLSLFILVVRAPNVVFFPINEPKYVNIFVELPVSSDIEKTNQVVSEMEKEVEEIITPYRSIVTSVITNIGIGATDPMRASARQESPNRAKIMVSFVANELRGDIKSSVVMKELSTKLKKRPGVIVNVDKDQNGPPAGKPINIEVRGEDFQGIIELAEKIQAKLESHRIPGIEGLRMDMEMGKPELLVSIDRAKARQFGLSSAQVGSTIRTALFGKEVSKFKDGEDDYPIMLRMDDKYRYSATSLLDQKITFRDMTTGRIVQVPVSSVADVTYASSYGSVERVDMDRTITIYSNVLEGYNETQINAQIQELFKNFDVPEGYQVFYTGKQMEQDKAQAFLANAFFIACALILLILVSQFNSIIQPVIIMVAVFFSLIGVFLGLAIFKMDVSVMMTGIGIVSLAGVVVNNAIVLIDFTNLTVARRKSELWLTEDQLLPMHEVITAIVDSGRNRLRPVLLTAITTVLGLIPMAIGLNIDFISFAESWDPKIYIGGDNVAFWGPMSWTIIFGLTFATFLTLVIVPVMYLMTHRVSMMFVKKG